nr:LysE family transporter [Burkholderia oklahomensis]
MNLESLIGFVVASVLVLAIPGPSFLYVIAVSRQQSIMDAAWNILGMGFGGIIIATLTAFGVATLIKGFPVILVFLKITGVMYFFLDWIEIAVANILYPEERFGWGRSFRIIVRRTFSARFLGGDIKSQGSAIFYFSSTSIRNAKRICELCSVIDSGIDFCGAANFYRFDGALFGY